jgi:hypothetical protein
METVLFWAPTQRVVVVPYRRFGTMYRSHLQVSRSARSLKMVTTGCPETSVRNYHYTRRKGLEEHSSLVSNLVAMFTSMYLCSVLYEYKLNFRKFSASQQTFVTVLTFNINQPAFTK